MAAGDKRFGGKIVLDGAAEYRAALNEITASQRTLNKEMKLAESEFKLTGDALKFYEDKVRLLNDQLENQNKKIETAQKALKELSDKGVSENSEIWQKWNGILLDAQAKVNNLQADLNATTSAMQEEAKSAELATEELEKLNETTERATQEAEAYSEALKSIALDGAEQYEKTLKEVANAQEDLNKEMKLAESEFKKTGDAQQLYNEKVRLLNAQMDNQKKKLETAQKALKELSDKGVDKNSDLWRKWNGILLDSQTKMNNLQAELNSTTAAMKDTADATEQVTSATERATQETADYSETLKSIDKGVKFQNVLKGLGLIKDAVGGVISTAYRMGKALVMSQVSGGDWAREIMMGAAAADLSVEEYQARQYAQALSGIEYGPIDESIQELRKRLNSTGEDAVAVFKTMNELGLASRETELQAMDAAKAFWEIVNVLDEIENTDTRNTLAERLFGDKYMQLRGLLNFGSEEYIKLIEEGREAAAVTEESVNALADMDAAYEKTSATAQSLMHNINAELAPGFTDMANAFGSILQDFNDFITSEEGKQTFDGWNKNLSEIADTIKDIDFKEALDGISKTTEAIASSFKAIGEVWKMIRQDISQFQAITDAENIAKNQERAKGKTLFEALTTEPKLPGWEEIETAGNQVGKAGLAALQVLARQTELSTEQRNQLADLKDYLIAAQEGYGEDNYTAIAQAFKDAMTAPGNDVFINQAAKEAMQAVIDAISESGAASYSLYAEAIAKFRESLNSELPETAETGGGGAMNAFNAAIEKGTADTKDKLKTGVTAAFSGFDSLFASMGAAHGSAYINALSAQMARINSMLSLAPSYAYGGTYYNPAQGAYASPTSTANVSLYVGREKFGQVATPIVDARMGADLMTMR